MWWNCRPQENAEIQPRALRRRPGALQTTSARSLLIRNNREAFAGAFRGETSQLGIGGRQRLESQQLWLEDSHMDEVDCKAVFTQRRKGAKNILEIPLVILALVAGAAFLTKMCYLSLAFNTAFVIVFLTLFYLYLRVRLNIRVPITLLGLVFLALQVDALGNFFRMYGRQFGPVQYDEFAHMAVQVLVSPSIVWVLNRLLQRYRLPLLLNAIFAATIVFSVSAAYEIIELWDEIYFGGRRIWGPYDTATDLQWDLCGIIVGTVFSCIMLRDTRDQLVPH
jgi:uncharacterized membrane protein YjdF